MYAKESCSFWGPLGHLLLGGLLSLTLLILLSCSSSEEPEDPINTEEAGSVSGTVKDEDGNVYPRALVSLSKGSEVVDRVTDAEGKYLIKAKSNGSHNLLLTPPLSTIAVTTDEATVSISENNVSNVDFVIEPQAVTAHLNFGNVQLLEEIVDANGNTPTASNEPLYAANIFDAPIGMLTAIKAPDDHHVTLSEFKKAQGELLVHCNGNSSTISVMLEGMIPGGTYTFWLAYLNRTRKVGENIDFANDFVFNTNPPIGASNGTENIAVADALGNINVVLSHSSCILTDQAALVIPILYHINGKTFGGGHVPDPEEMVHMLAYFQ